eukprot:3178815-Amphidinium_carterae.1
MAREGCVYHFEVSSERELLQPLLEGTISAWSWNGFGLTTAGDVENSLIRMVSSGKEKQIHVKWSS